jgi:two-component system, oxyanion-binding sensor
MNRDDRRGLTIGLLKLTDAAPVIMAKELGLFAAEDLAVDLSIEPSWATLADKLAYGFLDAAVLLPPLVLASNMGLREAARPLVVPLNLSLGGNTVTLSRPWSNAIDVPSDDGTALGAARAFARCLADRGSARKPVLAVVHAYSSHHLLLRYWLAAGGVDPDRDVSITVIPPARTVEALKAGQIDGFCAGAPWGELAARAGLGANVATSQGIWMNGPEKLFAVPRDWAEHQPEMLLALLRALLRAALYCDAPAHAEAIAATLAQPGYFDIPPDLLRRSLPDSDPPPPRLARSTFFANAANFPWRSHALWFLAQMARWGLIPDDVDRAAIAASTYRPDLYVEAARTLGLSVPILAEKIEGAHATPWLAAARPTPIAMGPDLFCDGVVFDPG